MTLEQAAEKQYLLFCSMTSKSTLPWNELPDLVKGAWMEVVRTCPNISGKDNTLEDRVAKLEQDFDLYCQNK